MTEIIKKKKIHILWILGTLLYILSFATYDQGYLIFFAFVPMLLAIEWMNVKYVLTYAWVYSLIFFLATLYWLIGFHIASLPFAFPGYALYSAFAFLMVKIISMSLPKWRIWALPFAWTIFEMIRSAGFLAVQWNIVSHALWQMPFFYQSADILGVYGVGFIVLLINSCIAEWIIVYFETKDIKKTFLQTKKTSILALVVFLLNLFYGIIQYNRYDKMSMENPQMKLGLLQANVEPGRSWWYSPQVGFDEFYKYQKKAVDQNVDMIVYSETLIPSYVWYPYDQTKYNQIIGEFYDLPKEFHIPMVLTHPEKTNTAKHNTADLVYYTSEGERVVQSYGKIHLAPFGEWFPVFRNMKGFKEMLDGIGAAWASPGTNLTIMTLPNGYKFAMLICFEDVYPELARIFVKKGINFLVNTTNDGWARYFPIGSDLSSWQHLASSTLLATSLRRALPRATNTGVTAIVYPTGKILYSDIPSFEKGIMVGDVPMMDENLLTIYVKIGYLLPYLMLLLGSVLYLIALWKWEIKE